MGVFQAPQSDQGGDFVCEVCGKSFKSNKSLATHRGHHVRRHEMAPTKSVAERTRSNHSTHSHHHHHNSNTPKSQAKVESTKEPLPAMGGAIASKPTVIELPRIIPMQQTHGHFQHFQHGQMLLNMNPNFNMMLNANSNLTSNLNSNSNSNSNRGVKRTHSQMEADSKGLCVTEPIVVADDSEDDRVDPMEGMTQIMTTLHEHSLVGPIKRMRGYKWDCDNKECPKHDVYKMHSSKHWKSSKMGDQYTWCNKCVFEHLAANQKGDLVETQADGTMKKKPKYANVRFNCPECGFGARSPSGLGSHRRKIHGVRGRFSKLPTEPNTPVATGPVKGTKIKSALQDQRSNQRQSSVLCGHDLGQQQQQQSRSNRDREYKPMDFPYEDSSSDSNSNSGSSGSSRSGSSGGSGSSESSNTGSSESSDDDDEDEEEEEEEEATSTDSQNRLMLPMNI